MLLLLVSSDPSIYQLNLYTVILEDTTAAFRLNFFSYLNLVLLLQYLFTCMDKMVDEL